MADKPYLILNDGSRLSWLSDEAEPANVRDGQVGEHLDTGDRFIYYRGLWHFQTGDRLKAYFSNAATSTMTSIKISAGLVYLLEVSNPNGVDAFLQLFDVGLDAVTVGTTTPTYSFLVPAGSTASNRGAFDRVLATPLKFLYAICYAVTTTPTGSTAPTSNLTMNVGYV